MNNTNLELNIGILFSKHHNKSYTRQALLYRDILKCGLTNINTFFRIWNLTRWLLVNNIEFKKSIENSELNTSKLIENREDRVKNAIKNLEGLNLVQSRLAYSTKGGAKTSEYRLTINGHYIALLLNIENKDANVKIYDEIYNLLIDYMANNPSSLDSFCCIFLTKCRRTGLFAEQCRYYLNRLRSADEVISINNSLEHLMFFLLEDKHLVKQLYITWRESLFELNEETRTLFLFYLKNGLDRIMERLIPNFSSYEEMRFQIKELNDMICVHAQCTNCQTNFYVVLHVIKYLDGIFLDSRLLPVRICESCNTGTLSIDKIYNNTSKNGESVSS